MATPSDRLKQLNLTLPPAPKPVGSYVPAVRTGRLIFTSGQLPLREGQLLARGLVGDVISLEQAAAAARQAVLNALAVLDAEAGGLDRIERIVRLNVFVASGHQFIEQAAVANGASELLVQVFGDAGRHTRCAVGVAQLPLGASVELDLVAEVRE
jgi:enamine deaminase RidA (YjgF/YER057c/UK114 family)